jgi:hypothetical protein
MHGAWLFRDDLCRVSKLVRRLQLTLGMNDFGAPLSLSLCLFGHGALHLLRQIDMFELHQNHFDAPGLAFGVEDFLNARIELFSLGKKLVQLGLTANTA